MEQQKIINHVFSEDLTILGAEKCKPYIKKELKIMFPDLFKKKKYAYGTVRNDYQHRHIVDTHADDSEIGSDFVLVINDVFNKALYVLTYTAIEMYQTFPNVELSYSAKNKELYKHKIKFEINQNSEVLNSKNVFKIIYY